MVKVGDRFIVEVEGVTGEFLGKKYCKLKGLGAYTFPVECIEALPMCEINEAVPDFEPVAKFGRVYRDRHDGREIVVVRCDRDEVDFINRDGAEIGGCTTSLFRREYIEMPLDFSAVLNQVFSNKQANGKDVE